MIEQLYLILLLALSIEGVLNLVNKKVSCRGGRAVVVAAAMILLAFWQMNAPAASNSSLPPIPGQITMPGPPIGQTTYRLLTIGLAVFGLHSYIAAFANQKPKG